MHRMRQAALGQRLAATHHLAHAFIGGDGPAHWNLALGLQSTNRRQAGPDHEAIGQWITTGHAQREGVLDADCAGVGTDQRQAAADCQAGEEASSAKVREAGFSAHENLSA